MKTLVFSLALTFGVAAAPLVPIRSPPEVAFDGDGLALVLKTVREAQREIVAAIYNFSEPQLVDAMLKARRQRNVSVRIKYDKAQATQEKMTLALKLLREGGVEVIECGGRKGGAYSAMHNKFMVVDASRTLTGSQNWSRAGFADKWENVIHPR